MEEAPSTFLLKCDSFLEGMLSDDIKVPTMSLIPSSPITITTVLTSSLFFYFTPHMHSLIIRKIDQGCCDAEAA